MVLRACRMACDKGAAAFHAHGARPDGAAIHLTQKGDAADGPIARLQFKTGRVKNVAIMRDIGAGGGGEPHAEAILRGVQAGSDGEMPAIIAHGGVPAGSACGMHIKPDAIVDDPAKRQRCILKTAFFAKCADADGEALYLADFHLA